MRSYLLKLCTALALHACIGTDVPGDHENNTTDTSNNRAEPDDSLVEAQDAALTLSLRENTPSSVAGTLANSTHAIAFSVERVGAIRRAVVLTTNGQELLDASIEGRIEQLSVLADRLVIRGEVTSTRPEITGDLEALAELHAMPEHVLAERLLDTLRAHGVEPSLVTPDRESSVQKAAGNHNEWYVLGQGQQRDFATWTFWIPTHVVVYNYSWEQWAQATLMCSWSSEKLDIPPAQYGNKDVRCGGIRLFVRNTSGANINIGVWVE